MGCIPSKTVVCHEKEGWSKKISDYEKNRILRILEKSPSVTTENDINTLKQFVKQYNNSNDMSKPLMLISDAQDRIEECEPRPIYHHGLIM